MKDVEREIVELEKQYWQAMIDKDVDKVLRLTADPCVVTGAMGVTTINHDQYRHMMDDAAWELLEFQFENVQTQQVTPDVVVTAYTVTENLLVDGKPLSLKAADSSTWTRKDASWVCVVHTESLLGDPFGRDRKETSSNRHPARKKSAASRRKPVAARRRKVKR